MDKSIYAGKKIFHFSDSDLDGIGCRLVAECLIAPYCDYIPLNSAERDMRDFDIELAKESDIIIFSDITPTVDLYTKLIAMNKPVYIFDHHISGKQLLGDLPNYIFDETKCGTRLLFEALTRNMRTNRTLTHFVDLVDTYDCWHTDSPKWQSAKDLSNVMYGYVNWYARLQETDTERYSEFLKAQHKKIQENRPFYFNYREMEMVSKAKRKEEKAYQEAKKSFQLRKDNVGNNYAYIEMSSKLSFVSYRILEEYSDRIQYVVAHSTWEKGSLKISIRSKSGFDVSEIAKKWGGGGHVGASAFVMPSPAIFNQFKLGKINLI